MSKRYLNDYGNSLFPACVETMIEPNMMFSVFFDLNLQFFFLCQVKDHPKQ